jgi:prevent-host-death family protein
MDSVSVSELKAQLSRYLRRVREGGEVQIVDRGKPVARLIGLGDAGRVPSELHRLIADGALRPGNGRMLEVAESEPITLDIDLKAAIIEERNDRL